MQTRRLGRHGPEVSAEGLGLMAMTPLYGPVDPDEAIATIRAALDAGMNHLDTSDAYADGKNEELLKHALAGGYRAKAFVATKFGNVRTPEGKPAANGRPEYVIEACEKSLARLGIDTIDLYYQHRVDPAVPIEDTVGAMGELVKRGKVRALGLSEAAPDTIRRAHATHPIAAVQSEYSLLYRVDAEETLKTTRALGIAYVAYSPLGRSLLTGSVKQVGDIPEGDGRGRHPRFAANNLARNLGLVGSIEGVARAKGCTPGQVALAWLLAQGPDIVPIPGTKRASRLDENMGALDVTLSPAEVVSLSAAIPPGAAAGGRYADAQMKAVFL